MKSVPMTLKNNKYQIKAIYILSLVLMLQGCGARMTALHLSGADDYDRIFDCLDCKAPLVASGKAKLEFSRYRFRGVFRLEYKKETLRIDFDHSSLFGAIKEEASIFIGKEGISVFDQKRGEYYDEDASGKLIRDAVGGFVMPSDILLALLLKYPGFSELAFIKAAADDEKWELGGIYKGREIEFVGEKGVGPIALRLSDTDDLCGFSVFYRYAEGNGCSGYPKEITIKTEDGSARINLDIKNIKRDDTP